MERTPVKSTSIRSVGWDPETSALEVEFHNGSVYRYDGVPAEKYHSLLEAESVGNNFANEIKNNHVHTRIDES